MGKYSTTAFCITSQWIEWWTTKRVVKVPVPTGREAFSRHPRSDRLWRYLPSYRLDTGVLSWGLKVTGTWNWPFIYIISVLENASSFSSVVFLLNEVLFNCSHYCDTFEYIVVCKQHFYWKQFQLFSYFIKPQLNASEIRTDPFPSSNVNIWNNVLELTKYIKHN